MGNGGDGRQAAERPPGEGGVRLRVRDRLGFLIYITHIGLGLLHLGWALLVSGGCGCTRGWKSGSAPAWNCGCGCGCTRGSLLGSAPAPIGSKTRGCPHPRVQLPSLIPCTTHALSFQKLNVSYHKARGWGPRLRRRLPWWPRLVPFCGDGMPPAGLRLGRRPPIPRPIGSELR